MTAAQAEWADDVLTGYQQATTALGPDPDGEGELFATLVRRADGTPARHAVLAVHGFTDYFFNTELADHFTARGFRFYALDQHKCGRSWREGQTPHFTTDLARYDRELERAVAVIAAENPGARVLVYGHSAGGLIVSLWLDRVRRRAASAGRSIAGLVLNSPWLEFQLARAGRQMLAPIIDLSARLYPRDFAPQLDFGYYTRAQHEVGPQEEIARINLEWRPERAQGVTSGWLRAILAGHAQVQLGLGIGTPVQVLLSARYALPTRWSEDLTRADTVLEVDEVAKAALKLGGSVTVERIDGALHDVFLSGAAPRREAYERLERWLTGWQAAARIPRPE